MSVESPIPTADKPATGASATGNTVTDPGQTPPDPDPDPAPENPPAPEPPSPSEVSPPLEGKARTDALRDLDREIASVHSELWGNRDAKQNIERLESLVRSLGGYDHADIKARGLTEEIVRYFDQFAALNSACRAIVSPPDARQARPARPTPSPPPPKRKWWCFRI